jgi:hypothetical protein
MPSILDLVDRVVSAYTNRHLRTFCSVRAGVRFLRSASIIKHQRAEVIEVGE